MRRNGLILLAIGVIVFLVASNQRKSYDSIEGVLKTTFSKNERSKNDLAGAGLWLGLGIGAVGIVMVFMPERKG